jgi:hypothetical protein
MLDSKETEPLLISWPVRKAILIIRGKRKKESRKEKRYQASEFRPMCRIETADLDCSFSSSWEGHSDQIKEK